MPTCKIGKTKVKRYWPGKVPEWANDIDEEDNDDFGMERAAALQKAFPSQEDSKHDPRLRRLALGRIDNHAEVRADHRAVRQAEILSTEEEENQRQEGLDMDIEEEGDEEALQKRRETIKEKSRLRQQEEAALLPDEDEEDEEEESEYETVSEEQIDIVMLKPVFVNKSDRVTVSWNARIKADELVFEELEKIKLKERRVKSKQMAVEDIRGHEKIQKNLDMVTNSANVNTDDEDNEAEYEAWKAREIERIKRKAMLGKNEKPEQVKNMTEEERRDPKPAPTRKRKWSFMQKYYHKGAFFQTDADDPSGTAGSDQIYQRDFSAPTGEDKMNKTILPKVMQVKLFGRSGRTKWTHLLNEDTTDWNNPWMYNNTLRAKYNGKMAALNAPIAKPKGSKKLKDWESRCS